MFPNFRAITFEGFQTVQGQVNFQSHQNRVVSQCIWTFFTYEHCVYFSGETEQGFKLNLTLKVRASHLPTGLLTKVFCTSDPNLVILAWMGDELWRGRASYGLTHRCMDAHTNRCRQRQFPKANTGLGHKTSYQRIMVPWPRWQSKACKQRGFTH